MPLLYGDSGHHWSPKEVQELRKMCFENVGDSNFKFKTLNIWTILTFIAFYLVYPLPNCCLVNACFKK